MLVRITYPINSDIKSYLTTLRNITCPIENNTISMLSFESDDPKHWATIKKGALFINT